MYLQDIQYFQEKLLDSEDTNRLNESNFFSSLISLLREYHYMKIKIPGIDKEIGELIDILEKKCKEIIFT